MLVVAIDGLARGRRQAGARPLLEHGWIGGADARRGGVASPLEAAFGVVIPAR